MPITLVADQLNSKIAALLDATHGEVNIISPFIGHQTATKLANWLEQNPIVCCNIITRFYREDFIKRVSSIHGLEQLLTAKANLFALVDLHAKLYVFDDHSLLLGSANFTRGGFISNHELVVLIEDELDVIDQANLYFDDLLKQIQSHGDIGSITQEWIDEEKPYVANFGAKQKNKSVTYANMKRRGVELQKIVRADFVEMALEARNTAKTIDPYWIKFEGTGSDRVSNTITYEQMKGRKGRALTLAYFPRRPSGITDNDILFLTIISYDEYDQPTPLIVGYSSTSGFCSAHEVTAAEIHHHAWKERFKYYVELSGGKAIASPIKYGIQLIDLYAALGKDTFPSLSRRDYVSQRTLHSMHFRRSHIRITTQASIWLKKELDQRFIKNGYIRL